jgi:hypothetical protein
MRGPIWVAASLLVIAPGCQSGPSGRTVAAAEPPLVSPAEPNGTVVHAPPPKTVTWADRHPLFTKPREYYDNSGNNKVVKAAAATVIGIPAGIVGELKQIVVGAPPDVRY